MAISETSSIIYGNLLNLIIYHITFRTIFQLISKLMIPNRHIRYANNQELVLLIFLTMELLNKGKNLWKGIYKIFQIIF